MSPTEYVEMNRDLGDENDACACLYGPLDPRCCKNQTDQLPGESLEQVRERLGIQ